jgi:hypothetical protein
MLKRIIFLSGQRRRCVTSIGVPLSRPVDTREASFWALVALLMR